MHELAPLLPPPKNLEVEPDAEGDVAHLNRPVVVQPGPAEAPALVLQFKETLQHLNAIAGSF